MTDGRRVRSPARRRLPAGSRIVLDDRTRVLDDHHLLLGGARGRAVRLTDLGAATVAALGHDGHVAPAGRPLATRLVDAGLAHPRPAPPVSPPDVTVVIPVRDRPAELDRCLAAVAGTPVVVVDDGSCDTGAVADVCRRHGVRLLRRADGAGPAAARNTALAEVRSALVAFLDSDCVPPPGWIAWLSGHFDDPDVGAVAPRIVPIATAPPASVLARFSAARSPLDLGHHPAAVVPGGRVPYVPTAALVVRRAAMPGGFDPALRYGEDVDLVWRLHDGGWVVRYDPTVTVAHHEPGRWRRLLARRRRYGTAAAPLSRRHAGRLAPAVLRPVPAAVAVALLARRPSLAAGVMAGAALRSARQLRRLGAPTSTAVALVATGTGGSLRGAAQATLMLGWPAVLAACAWRRTRPVAVAALLGPALAEWVERRPALDPLRWFLACLADDVAYGLGVWQGAVTGGTAAPLTPALRR